MCAIANEDAVEAVEDNIFTVELGESEVGLEDGEIARCFCAAVDLPGKDGDISVEVAVYSVRVVSLG